MSRKTSTRVKPSSDDLFPISDNTLPLASQVSPPPALTADTFLGKRHANRGGVSSTYEYLSALSHGFDSHTLSLSDLAQTITTNSSTAGAAAAAASNPPRYAPPPPGSIAPSSPHWEDPEDDAPFSSLFGRASSSSSALNSRSRDLFRRHSSSGSFRSSVDTTAPSLPHPDLGGDFEPPEDMLRSSAVEAPDSNRNTDTAVPSPLMFPHINALTPVRPPSPAPPSPPHPAYTGPFRLTMQRRDEYSRRAVRRPDPPTIPPLRFGANFDDEPALSPQPERQETRHRLLGSSNLSGRPAATRRWVGPPSRTEISPVNSSRLADAERRLHLFNYAGPSGSRVQPPSESTPPSRRPIPSRTVPVSSTSYREAPRYSAADMHNVLARQARLEGSRLDLPSAFGGAEREANPLDLNHTGSSASSASRAQRLISQFHEQIEAAEISSSNTHSPPWATMSRRVDSITREADARRRRFATRSFLDDENPRPRPLRESLRGRMSPSHVVGVLRRRALGDYVRDEDFDTSYESLLSLSGLIGDARPKGTSDETISGLESAQFQDWATADSDQRCPICLDDVSVSIHLMLPAHMIQYEPSDTVMRLSDCRHWLHKDCLVQWLKGASTCPVCRKDVKGKAPARRPHHHVHGHHHHPFRPHRRDSDGPPGGSGSGPAGRGAAGGGNGADVQSWLSFLRE
ncbi:RING-type domain-containing protein [Mycena chlorophos]|uniref:RING-type E3 ubiquitin transferase n=1 Tax=Mycena chlorophos TaxID=658473 RepID=A0A8H6RXP9_MYCCL|nr:RING-type domain-containing protein [Mycena chlorophos]